MSKIFKFVSSDFKRATGETETPTDRIREVIAKLGQGKGLKTSPKLASPLGNGVVDIVDDFRWTKSDKKSIARKGTPKITLRELQVINPSFFNNISTILDQLAGNHTNAGLLSILKDSFDPNRTDRGDALANTLSLEGYDEEGGVWSWIKKNLQKGLANAEAGTQRLQLDWQGIKQLINPYQKLNFPDQLKFYENIYGIVPTSFIYRVPYLQDGFKQVSSSWSVSDKHGFISNQIDRISSLVGAAAPNVGIDFAKSFQYPSEGPSHDVTFYLDNTVYNGKPATEHAIADNINFVYLLLYQNLPSRISRTGLMPPVIYEASLPGVFSYRWSFLSNIVINFVGNRRKYRVNIGGNLTEAVIPEGYEIQLTVNSLTPETKNLMYDSIDSSVTSSEELTPKIGPWPEDKNKPDFADENDNGIPDWMDVIKVDPWDRQGAPHQWIRPPEPGEFPEWSIPTMTREDWLQKKEQLLEDLTPEQRRLAESEQSMTPVDLDRSPHPWQRTPVRGPGGQP